MFERGNVPLQYRSAELGIGKQLVNVAVPPPSAGWQRPCESLTPPMSSDTRMPSLQMASLGSKEFSNPAKSGYNKGTIRRDFWYLVVSKNVRRHRLISIDYITALPCHGRGREFESRRPRHFFQALTESAPFSRGHKKAQNRYRKRALARQSSRLLHFLRAQESDHGILCIAFLSRYRLSVRIERHANRGVTQQFLMIFNSAPVDRSSVE